MRKGYRLVWGPGHGPFSRKPLTTWRGAMLLWYWYLTINRYGGPNRMGAVRCRLTTPIWPTWIKSLPGQPGGSMPVA